MQFIHKMEKDDQESTTTTQPLISIFASRGFDGGRLKFLVGGESRTVGRDADGTERPTIEVGAFSGEISERPLDVQDSEQVEAIGLLNDHRAGDDAQGSDDTQL